MWIVTAAEHVWSNQQTELVLRSQDVSRQEIVVYATVQHRKWVLTPDAQLITALGGTADVDPDEHIRAFKHTHTGTVLVHACHFMHVLAAT